MVRQLVVIPAYNEASTIQQIIKNLYDYDYKDKLVVDDQSTDSTAELALSSGAKVLTLPYNVGAWKATQTGLRYAHAKKYQRVITFDADGQHLASSLASLITNARSADIVIGSCVTRGSLARHLAWGFFRKLSGVYVKDITSGLRLYNRQAIKALSCEEATLLEYQDVGVLLLLKAFKLSTVEVDVSMEERMVGASRIFYSWLAVSYYMAYTTTLCLSKVFKTQTIFSDND